MSLFSLFHPAKDFALEMAVKVWFNQSHKRYGNMTRIQIDSQSKRIEVELDLKGETSPLRIEISSYQLSSEAGETFIHLGTIDTSREWVNALLDDYLKPDKRRFKVPGAVKVLL